MQQDAPSSTAMSRIPPPTAIPAIAPVDSFLEEDGPADFVGLGMARVGDRDAIEACCVKYTARSLFSKPPAGAVAVAPPMDLENVSNTSCFVFRFTYEPPTTEMISEGTT